MTHGAEYFICTLQEMLFLYLVSTFEWTLYFHTCWWRPYNCWIICFSTNITIIVWFIPVVLSISSRFVFVVNVYMLLQYIYDWVFGRKLFRKLTSHDLSTRTYPSPKKKRTRLTTLCLKSTVRIFTVSHMWSPLFKQ